MIRLLALLSLLITIFPGFAASAEKGEVPLGGIYRGDQPISISSDRLEADDAANRVHFSG